MTPDPGRAGDPRASGAERPGSAPPVEGVLVTGGSGDPRGGLRGAAVALALGALAVVPAAATYKVFELDRFFVPKELVLHLTALLAGILALKAFRRTRLRGVDVMLVAFLLVGALSSLFATNEWAAMRALSLGASSVAVFWVARSVAAAGHARLLLGALALAVVLGCGTALLQAYGVRTELFSINRAPGGTLGNRNFVAHLSAFGFPVVLLAALGARRATAYLFGAGGVMLVVATLVLTRSRAGWLAFAVVLLVVLMAQLLAPALRGHRRTWLRLLGILLVGGAGVAAAVLAPNTLRWRSENPYVESVRGVANYQEGSGRGRLIQYRRSLGMVAERPVLGVGPGNWPVVYPSIAPASDPSLDRRQPGTTSNPWPSSDWVAFVSERGPLAAALLLLALLALALQGVRRAVRAQSPETALGQSALVATVAAALVAGLFDAVLLLALPALLVWATLGALAAPGEEIHGSRRGSSPTAALLFVLLLSALGVVRSGAQLAAMAIYDGSESSADLRRAAAIDPGNYRLHLRLARTGPRQQRCEHARAAHALFPSARAARNLADRCG